MITLPFTCPRTCPRFGDPTHCRFAPVIHAVDTPCSHTTAITVEIRDRDAFGRAAQRLGGTVIGLGSHRLYSTTEQGYAVHLPNWRYPIILQQDGSRSRLAMDHYNGAWGHPNDLTRLTHAYVIEVARAEAERLGWMVEEHDNTLLIYHPSGGTLTVTGDGTVDATGFLGQGCHDAALPIEQALGVARSRILKPEYEQQHAEIRLPTQ